MAEKIPPDEVARLDPFGKREIPASRKLEELLAERETREPELKEFEADLIMVEQEAWKRVLGVNFTIPPLPTEITQEVKQKLEEEGFTLVFLPSLDLEPHQLEKESITQYLRRLTAKYPNWSRNLRKWFWRKVKNGYINFPTLPHSWAAVETLPPPNKDEKYQKTAFDRRLGFDNRFNVSWYDVETAIEKAKSKFLLDMGLGLSNVRFLNVLEWNLLANREGWSGTDTYEWTNTEHRVSSAIPSRLVAGCSAIGDTTFLHWLCRGRVGFRITVEISS